MRFSYRSLRSSYTAGEICRWRISTLSRVASELLSENKALRRRLEEALLRLEGYEIMGDILQEEYGIDLLKKSAAGQSSVSKKDTQQ